MALFLHSPPPLQQLVKSRSPMNPKLPPLQRTSLWSRKARSSETTVCFFNPIEEPIVKEALKEPVAFLGGVFAGLLRLDLNEDPLKEWVTRTVEASGFSEEDVYGQDSTSPQGGDEESPQQIQIE